MPEWDCDDIAMRKYHAIAICHIHKHSTSRTFHNTQR